MHLYFFTGKRIRCGGPFWFPTLILTLFVITSFLYMLLIYVALYPPINTPKLTTLGLVAAGRLYSMSAQTAVQDQILIILQVILYTPPASLTPAL